MQKFFFLYGLFKLSYFFFQTFLFCWKRFNLPFYISRLFLAHERKMLWLTYFSLYYFCLLAPIILRILVGELNISEKKTEIITGKLFGSEREYLNIFLCIYNSRYLFLIKAWLNTASCSSAAKRRVHRVLF